MKSKFTWMMTLCLALFIQISFAQEKSISGTVISKEDKQTMPGVNILVKGTKRGTQTDFNGEFTIKASVGEKLVITSIGSTTQTITVGASNKIMITMESEVKSIGEVVVEGYNVTRTKSQSNVASKTVSAKTIENRPNANFIATLQGQVAGLQIGVESGQPGGSNYAVIRGSGSLQGEDEPMYVIDGTPMGSDNFRSINPDEIESVSVLKDAGATSIYGNRGANGVIVVRTKRGSFDSALDFRYISSTGFTQLQSSKLNLMNSQEMLAYERYYGKGFGAHFLGDPSRSMTDAEIAAAGTTNWRDQFFRTGITQNHTLNITSGSKNLASSTTLGYFKQEGTLQNSGLQRFTYRNNLNGKSNDGRFNYNTNLSINYSQNNSVSSSSGSSIFFNPVWSAILGHPYLNPSMYTDGASLWQDYKDNTYGAAIAPLTMIDYLKRNELRTEEFKGVMGMGASYKLTDKLTYSTDFGVDYIQSNNHSFQHPDSFLGWAIQNNNTAIPRGQQSQSFGKTAYFDVVNKLNYKTKFGEKHSLDATIYMEYIKNHTQGFSYTQKGIDPKQATPGSGIGYITDDPSDATIYPTNSSSKASTGLLSYFGTVDYDYANKYGVGVTLRRDASSRFANTYRWGTFYSVTGRWNVDREDFMKGSPFNMLKVRGSFGTNGNNDLTGNPFGGLNISREVYSASNGYGYLPGYAVQQLAITDLRWEASQQADLGTDFEVFNRRLEGTLDFYNKNTTDLYQLVTIDPINATPQVTKNYGAMVNKGIELSLKYTVLRSADGLNIKLNCNGSYNKNNVTKVAGETHMIDNGTTIIAEGHPANEYYTIKYLGVNPADGNLLYLDKNGNPTENPTTDDRVYTGKTMLPKYQGGFGFDVDYKGFYLSTMFSYVLKSYKFDYDEYWIQNPQSIGLFNLSKDMLRAWTPSNIYTDIPSVAATNYSMETSSDRYLKDASYLRLKNINLGYNFSRKSLAKTPFKSFKIYGQAENLVTWAKWRGLDVQTPSSATALAYPVAKIVSIGLQIEF